MTRWNPNDPSVIGPEFMGSYASSLGLQSLATHVVQGFRSNAAESIAALRLYYSVSDTPYSAACMAEVFAAGDEVDDGAATVVTYAPNVLTNVVTTTDQGGGAASVTDVDEWPPDLTDYLEFTGPVSSFDLEFASAGFTPTGRIIAVAVEVVTPRTSGASSLRRVLARFINGGLEFGDWEQVVPVQNGSGTAGRAFISWGEVNPITDMPWTEQDIQDLDSGTTAVRFVGETGGRWAAVRLVVVYEDTERRVASGAFRPPTFLTAPVWSADWDLQAPDGTPGWAKADATDYTLVIRRANEGSRTALGGRVVSLATLHGLDGNPPDLPSYDGESTITTFLVDGTASISAQVMDGAVPVANRLVPFVLRTTAPATSADGQPFASVRKVPVSLTSGSTQQELRTSTTDVYSGLRLTAGWYPTPPTADLIVAVKRRSDNATMGTFTVPSSAVASAAIGELVLVEAKAPDPGFTLTAATQYFLDYSSGGGPGWVVGLLAVDAGGGGVLYQEATYSGGTDMADPIAGAAYSALDYTPADFAAVLEGAVDPPSSFAGEAAEQALPDTQPCPLSGIPYASLAWDPTGLGPDFGSYEVERLAPDGVTWQTIAALVDEDDDGFSDVEARLGVEESYRLRVVRSDGSSSYYTDVIQVTVPAAGCGYTFTSNVAPLDSVGYPDVYDSRPIRGYDFLEAAEVQFRVVYGRDDQVAFHPLTRRGESFGRRLLIGGLAAPALGFGPPAFALLRNLAWASLPYVCVRDNDGNRWYANVRVPSGETRQLAPSDYLLWAQVVVVSVTQTPFPATAGTNTPGGPMLFIAGDPMLFIATDPMEFVT